MTANFGGKGKASFQMPSNWFEIESVKRVTALDNEASLSSICKYGRWWFSTLQEHSSATIFTTDRSLMLSIYPHPPFSFLVHFPKVSLCDLHAVCLYPPINTADIHFNFLKLSLVKGKGEVIPTLN
jgi:hypothetical protein